MSSNTGRRVTALFNIVIIDDQPNVIQQNIRSNEWVIL